MNNKLTPMGLRRIDTPQPEQGSSSLVGYGCAIQLEQCDSMGLPMQVAVIGLTPDAAAVICEYITGQPMNLEHIKPVAITPYKEEGVA